MSAVLTPVPVPVAAPGPRRWTREEFYRLGQGRGEARCCDARRRPGQAVAGDRHLR